MENRMATTIAATLLIGMTVLIAAPAAAEEPAPRQIVIPDGTEVRLRLLQPVSSASAMAEDPVLFEAVQDVVVGGVTVIRGGASGQGTVIAAQHRKGFGRRGKLEFTLDTIEAVNGQMIPLRVSKSLRGQDKYSKAGVVTLLVGPFGILVKGRDVEVPAGTEYTIHVDGERRIRLPASAT